MVGGEGFLKRSEGSAPLPTHSSSSILSSSSSCNSRLQNTKSVVGIEDSTEARGESQNCGSGRSTGHSETNAVGSRGPHDTAVKPQPWSTLWYAHRLRDQPPENAANLLRTLVHHKRQMETTPEVLRELNALSLEDASDAIAELR